jgi:hypothetical protein
MALSFLLALGSLAAVPSPASAAPGAPQFCTEVIRPLVLEFFGIKLTQGACVSALQTGNFTAAASSICKSEFLSDANHGKCTQFVKALLEEIFS